MALTPPFAFQAWIDAHRHLLKPPVGNCEVYPGHEFIVQVVGGPNSRTDYHVDPAEEFFYQLEGDMVLRVVDDGAVSDIPIRQGEIFLLPKHVPHSPQRQANTVGLVVERRRAPGELDAFEWYCERCSTLLYRAQVQMVNIVKDLPPIFVQYESDIKNRTCTQCAWVMPVRASPQTSTHALLV